MRHGYLIEIQENPKGVVPLGVFFRSIKMILKVLKLSQKHFHQ